MSEGENVSLSRAIEDYVIPVRTRGMKVKGFHKIGGKILVSMEGTRTNATQHWSTKAFQREDPSKMLKAVCSYGAGAEALKLFFELWNQELTEKIYQIAIANPMGVMACVYLDGTFSIEIDMDEIKNCPTCTGPTRTTKGMVCQTCGRDFMEKND